MLLIIFIAIEIFLIAFGILLRCGIGVFLIAGYNTLSFDERAKIDKNKLGKYYGRLLFALSICWLFMIASEIFYTSLLLYIGIPLFIIVAVGGLIYINTLDISIND